MWCTAIHYEVLKNFFNLKYNRLVTSKIETTKITITPDFFNRLETEFSKNTVFQQWVQLVTNGSSPSLEFKDKTSCPSKIRLFNNPTCDDIVSGYSSGSQIIIDTTLPNINTQNPDYLNFGIEELDICNSDYPKNVNKTPVLQSIPLKRNGTESFSILEKYFLAEDRVVIYDKYINNNTMDFLSFIASKLQNNSNLIIFTSKKRKNTLDTNQIVQNLETINSNLNINAYVAHNDFISDHHDRFIFLGDRIHMVFPAGLDSFGPINTSTGLRKNKYTQINIYATNKNNTLTINSNDNLNSVIVYCYN